MSKMYKKNTGLIVLSGPVVAIESVPQGTKVSIEIDEQQKDKTWGKRIITATSTVVDEDVLVGCIGVAVGYQCGESSILASVIKTGPSIINPEPDVEIISGMVQKAYFEPELQEDGTPKLKRDGSPRKPHFNVSMIIPDAEGHRVIHTTKIYNFKELKNGSTRTEIEKAQNKFKDFVDKDTTPMVATIVTQPGVSSEWENEFNGNVYQNFGCSHLGKMSWDICKLKPASAVVEPVHETPIPAPTPAQNMVNSSPNVQQPIPNIQTQASMFQQPVESPIMAPPYTQMPSQQVAQQRYYGAQFQPSSSIVIEDDNPVRFS